MGECFVNGRDPSSLSRDAILNSIRAHPLQSTDSKKSFSLLCPSSFLKSSYEIPPTEDSINKICLYYIISTNTKQVTFNTVIMLTFLIALGAIFWLLV